MTIRGAGKDLTHITYTSPSAMWVLTDGDRVTGIDFTCGIMQAKGSDWRVDHNNFSCNDFQTFGNAVWAFEPTHTNAAPRGLIDHNTFLNQRILVVATADTRLAGLDGGTQWSDALGLGTNTAVYIEDNDFSYTIFGNVVDCNYGGRYVFRHNTVRDSYVEAHDPQGNIADPTLPASRACRKWEIYENTITNSGTPYVFRTMDLRGGTGVVFNNTINDSFGFGITFQLYRKDNYGFAGTACDGTSPWDGNQDAFGYPCLDQIGRGGDSLPFDGTPPPYPVQSLVPVYLWNNIAHPSDGSGAGTPVPVSNFDASGNGGTATVTHINRDYYVDVGAKPGYTAYTYPHPLNVLP